MPVKPQERKWYQLSIRDQFMFGGSVVGFIALVIIERLVHPRPHYLDFLVVLGMLVGAGIGELVKRRRNLT